MLLAVPLLEREITRLQNYFMGESSYANYWWSKNRAGAASPIFIADLLGTFM